MARLVVALVMRRDSLCEGGVMARVLLSLLFAFFAPLVAWVGGYGFDERGTAAVFTLVMGAFLFVWTFFWPGWGDVRPTWASSTRRSSAACARPKTESAPGTIRATCSSTSGGRSMTESAHRLCIDCKHHIPGNANNDNRCAHPRAISLVDGRAYKKCFDERSAYAQCGVEGRRFDPGVHWFKALTAAESAVEWARWCSGAPAGGYRRRLVSVRLP